MRVWHVECNISGQDRTKFFEKSKVENGETAGLGFFGINKKKNLPVCLQSLKLAFDKFFENLKRLNGF